MKNLFIYVILIIGPLLFFACKTKTPAPDDPVQQAVLPVSTAKDIPADPNNMDIITYYDLDGGEITSGPGNVTWDIAFDGTAVYFNSGTSGPGQGTAQVIEGKLFSEIITAPESGYKIDDEGGNGLAVPTGSGNGWYTYAGAPTHKIEPIPGRVIVLKTGENNYAKMEITGYYQGNPDLSKYIDNPPAEADKYYTFNYVVQENGSPNF